MTIIDRRIRIFALLSAACLTGLFACGTAAIADETASDSPQSVVKRGRLMQAVEKGKTPKFARPGESLINESNAGLDLYARMGAELPDLPPEKPFLGKVQRAFGAYQRGFYKTALDLALPDAQKGDVASQTLVAELMMNGLGTRRNPTDASFWFEQAANGGDPNAQYRFALMLMEGKQVKRDMKRADELMRKAAEGGNKEAQFNLAQVLVAASPGEKGLLDALPWYEKSAKQGVPDAQYALSQLYSSLILPPEKREQARYWLQRAALAGFDTALYDMGVWLVNGIGGDRNYEEGFRWMLRAAIRGNIAAQNKVAHLYVNAIGTRPDPVEAAKWYVLSRRAGYADLDLEDFFLGINDEQQQEAIKRADAFLAR
ncbi:tetratricopeptide repeat protein [Rhizobium alvei]|uniref:Tetratricopeptide repeat protein n=1 Tax=Rhizobium alvei TaxID=1132659 RepID=A0ABT8YP22_9HYPH|nr:tetratricopeptide repeat protein [Rhizobium alvei]MDO6964960.1 tetratricopeptide repeat protein [Rhizobium alvei]